MPHIPSRFSQTSLPQQPLGSPKPRPQIPIAPKESGRRDSRIISKLDPKNWQYDVGRVLDIMYPEKEWKQDEHTRGLV